jgi:phage terminase large subunit
LVKWGALLEYEAIAEQAQAIADSLEPTVCALFDPETGFKPSGRGQLKFFEWFPLQPEQPEHIPPRWVLAAGGIGSGKTRSGAIWAILNSLWNPDIRGLIVSNTFTQLYSSTLIGLLEACEEYGIPYDPMGSSIEESAIKIANSRRVYIGEQRMFWRVLSVGAFIGKSQTGRGAEYQRIWIDEGAYTPEQGFQVLDGRLRSSRGDKCQGLITTSPNGFNWLYYRFADPARKQEIKDIYCEFCITAISKSHK